MHSEFDFCFEHYQRDLYRKSNEPYLLAEMKNTETI